MIGIGHGAATARTDLSFRRVEHHMSTAITLAGGGIDDASADRFFGRVAELEDLLSRFRPHSQISQLMRGELDRDQVDPAIREVLVGCESLRALTDGDFEHEPRQASGNADDLLLDVNAYAKGWIIEDAATALRMTADGFFVNAGGDILATPRPDGTPWRVGIQHPADRGAILGTFEVIAGAIATSGAYERGHHIRTATAPRLSSVTVTGADLARADGLATAVYASGESPPTWWLDVEPSYGLLTLSVDNRIRWIPPRQASGLVWHFPSGPTPEPVGT